MAAKKKKSSKKRPVSKKKSTSKKKDAKKSTKKKAKAPSMRERLEACAADMTKVMELEEPGIITEDVSDDDLKASIIETAEDIWPEDVPQFERETTALLEMFEVALPTPKEDAGGSEDGKASAPKKKSSKKKSSKKKSSKKKSSKKEPVSPKEKFLQSVQKKAGVEERPSLEDLMAGKNGDAIPISDIAVFIQEPDGILGEIAEDFAELNIVNLSAAVELRRVKQIGAELWQAGRMYQPIHVADVDGSIQCTSGRHRLAFLALAYGTAAEVPVYREEMDLCRARDAVVVANQARRAKAREKAEHAVLQAVGGNAEADQDELYTKTATKRTGAVKYAVYSVFGRGKPAKFKFGVTNETTRQEGELATVNAIGRFWKAALNWDKKMSRKDYDAQLKDSIAFLNTLAEAFQEEEEFVPKQHMASMTLCAIGKYYQACADAGTELEEDTVQELAESIVAMGNIGRDTWNETYNAIVKAMK